MDVRTIFKHMWKTIKICVIFEKGITKQYVFRAKHRQTFIFKHFFRQTVISLQFYRGGSFRGPAATHPSRENLKVSLWFSLWVGRGWPPGDPPAGQTHKQTNKHTEYSRSPPGPHPQRAQEWNKPFGRPHSDICIPVRLLLIPTSSLYIHILFR